MKTWTLELTAFSDSGSGVLLRDICQAARALAVRGWGLWWPREDTKAVWATPTPFSRNNGFLINDFASYSLKLGFAKFVFGLVTIVKFPIYTD